jgi:Mg2+ and Co2+ transporter CorA
MVNVVHAIDPAAGTATRVSEDEIPALLQRDDVWVWVDVTEPEDATRELLNKTLGIHPRAVEDGMRRNHVARLHHYTDVLFLALHRPFPGDHGHVHYLELDQYIGPRFLVTLHGPRNPVVPLETLLTETTDIAARLVRGRLRPSSPMALAYAVTSASTNADERTVNDLAESVGGLEQRVMRQEDDHQPQAFLDQLFTTRHTLLTVRTMAAQAAEVIERAVNLTVDWDKRDRRMLKDLRDQYHRLDRISRAQLDFLEGVTDFYRARNDTRMTLAGERLAVIAAITLPVTAISSILGMNVIVNDRTHWGWLVVLLAVMTALSLWLLRWAHKQGWW